MSKKSSTSSSRQAEQDMNDALSRMNYATNDLAHKTCDFYSSSTPGDQAHAGCGCISASQDFGRAYSDVYDAGMRMADSFDRH